MKGFRKPEITYKCQVFVRNAIFSIPPTPSFSREMTTRKRRHITYSNTLTPKLHFFMINLEIRPSRLLQTFLQLTHDRDILSASSPTGGAREHIQNLPHFGTMCGKQRTELMLQNHLFGLRVGTVATRPPKHKEADTKEEESVSRRLSSRRTQETQQLPNRFWMDTWEHI
ncbi:hypothetical protein PoB_002691800 [Plakobranchus ocellatus]|uniref:Uncharacterized protein n=1 Tax=Plakobranchus ocellatus TaxID=259542 RepID=A0AAV3ZZU6_9GAST|nr:hypothetical protein PoB_002691800 [Plakobranchus ocellatus]